MAFYTKNAIYHKWNQFNQSLNVEAIIVSKIFDKGETFEFNCLHIFKFKIVQTCMKIQNSQTLDLLVSTLMLYKWAMACIIKSYYRGKNNEQKNMNFVFNL